jgi:hypothetical protein
VPNTSRPATARKTRTVSAKAASGAATQATYGATAPPKQPPTPEAKLEIHVPVYGMNCRPQANDVKAHIGEDDVTLTRSDSSATETVWTGTIREETALVEVVAAPFTCACVDYEPEIGRSLVQVKDGCTSKVTLVYGPGSSTVEITPRLENSAGSPVPGVKFRLYKDADTTGTPLVRVTSPGHETASFGGLTAKAVTIIVDPPKTIGDDQPIELQKSQNTTVHVNLVTGRLTNLDGEFLFKKATGAVDVHLIDDAGDPLTLAGIPVRLVSMMNGAAPVSIPMDQSDGNGIAQFATVPAGTYCVGLATDTVFAGGREWTASQTPVVTVTAGDSPETVKLPLSEDLHIVRGTVYGPDGQPAAYAVVEIRNRPEDQTPIDTVVADECGHYEWQAEHAGSFFLTTVKQDGHLSTMIPIVLSSVTDQDIHVNPPAGGGGASSTDKDPTPFPLLVGNVDLAEGTAPGSRSGGGGYGGESSAGATVSAAIRDVLGYRTRTTDTKGFIAALQRSFTCVDKPGYTLCAWTPRSYAATIPADLGALTGAQASIFERAKGSADAILPLLEGLKPLGSATDDEDAEAIKAIVRSRVSEIVDELSIEGGPRTQRVDELFERLTGYRLYPSSGIVFFNVNTLRGELLKLGERLDMVRKNVNTIGEEENFTNFLIIVDSIATLFVIWQQARPFFVRDGVDDPTTENDAPFLGTQLVLISRQLGVVSETVRECYFAMDSVFLGPAERQTVLLSLDEGGIVIQGSAAPVDSVFPTPRPKTAMLLSELLDWIDRFCTDEGPQLIEEAGTDGVNAFVPTVRRLAQLAKSATQQSKSDTQIPPSYFTGRVQLSLAQLASQLARAATLADAVFERLNLPDVNSNGSASNQGGWR